MARLGPIRGPDERPAHPDMAELMRAVVANDDEASLTSSKQVLERFADDDSVTYMAGQRLYRMMQLRLLSPLSTGEMTAAMALWTDGFTCGARFQKERDLPAAIREQAREALVAAGRAAAGDSNDEEIEALQECADILASLLGLGEIRQQASDQAQEED